MMNFLCGLLIMALSYVIGSTPVGLLIGKSRGLDVRLYGSRNIGATNVRRVMGRKWGIACFLLDFLKGYLPVRLFGEYLGEWMGVGKELGEVLAAIGAVLGHVYPFWLMFKGGKGVSTSLGVVCGLAPLTFLIGGLAWTLSFYVLKKGIVSVASMLAVVVMAVWGFLYKLMSDTTMSWWTVLLLIVLAALVVYRHRENIRRLIDGTENSFVTLKQK